MGGPCHVEAGLPTEGLSMLPALLIGAATGVLSGFVASAEGRSSCRHSCTPLA
jgi:hypothetical protein